MMRILFRSLLAISAGLVLSIRPAAAADAPPQRPNILFLFSDDHALSTISAYGRTLYGGRVLNETPNIDRIAKEGAIFTRSFCTNSICVPSRATVLTGKFSHKNGVYGLASRWTPQQTFPKLLAAAGYQTALIGKWHLVPQPTDEFDYWKVLSGNGGQGDYYNPSFSEKGKPGEHQETGTSSDIIVADSIRWLEQRDKSKPFLMMTQFKAPHVHRMPAPRFLTAYSDVKFPEPPTFHDDYAGRSAYLSKSFMKFSGMDEAALNIFPPDKPLDPASKTGKALARLTPEQREAFINAYSPANEEYYRLKEAATLTGEALLDYKYQRYMRDYARCVAEVDDNVGKLLQWLDTSGLAANTIVIYCSDQGFFNGEHGWTDKRMMNEESFMMPFLIRWPGVVQPGRTVDAMIQNIDYAPTFLDIAGAPIPADLQGRSLLPILRTGKAPEDWRKSLYYHYYDDGSYNLPRIEGVRTARYKLIRYYIPGQREDWDLMDLEKDPLETKSFRGQEGYDAIEQELRAELARLRKAYEVPDREPTRAEVNSVHQGKDAPKKED